MRLFYNVLGGIFSALIVWFLLGFTQYSSAKVSKNVLTIDAEVQSKIISLAVDEIIDASDAEKNEVRVHIASFQLRPTVNISEWREVRVYGMGSLRSGLEGVFSLPVQIITSNGRSLSTNAYGTLEITAPIYVASKKISSKDVISASDLKRVILPWKILRPGYEPLMPKEIIGRSSKVRLNSGDAFSSNILDEPLAVRNGEVVSVTLKSGPGVLIRSRGVARSNGKIGETIKVQNKQSKKYMEVIVTGEKEVELVL